MGEEAGLAYLREEMSARAHDAHTLETAKEENQAILITLSYNKLTGLFSDTGRQQNSPKDYS